METYLIDRTYEQKYKDALERAKAYHRNELSGTRKEMTEYIFPELRESEDERIRKCIAYIVKCFVWRDGFEPVTKEDCLAWLEKQKEQKEELVYRLNGLMQEYINESKDEEEQVHRFKCYKLFWDAIEDISYFDEQKEQNPITPQMMDMAASECIYGQCGDNRFWIIEKAKNDIIEKTNIESSPDEMKVLDNILFRAWQMGWLSKYDVIVSEQKPVEWSEEDERMLSRCIKSIETSKLFADSGTFKEAKDKEIAWLKSLRPQKKWKPSEEQMNALHSATNLLAYNAKDVHPLRTLYVDLKKLMEDEK